MRTTLVLALLVMVSSCLKVDIVLPDQEMSNISLSFISRDNAQTRAAAGTEKGDDLENAVESIDVFFYDEDAGDDDNALYHMRIEENDLVASADNSTDNINYSYTASIPTDVIKEIFGENTTCNKIYAIANISADTEFQSTSITDLKETILNTDFSQSQTSFVMSGESSEISFSETERKIKGTVELSRSASKIELIIKDVLDIPVTDEYGNQKKDSNGNLVVWIANTEEMIVSLQKGVKKSYIDYIDGYCELLATDYFNTRDVKLVKDGKNGWKHATPFYTYPSNWEKEGATETYLKLIVPWSKSDAPGVNYNTYYTIPISETGLVRNTYYKIELTVGRLGTFDEGEDVVLTPASYYIYNWSTNTIRTELLDYRYLVVDQKEYTIYNQNELYIPFSSSHDVEIVSITCTQEDLSVVGAEPKEVTDYTLSVVNGNVYFKNNLENDMSKDGFDFTPITLTFTLRHKDNAKYNEVITVTQYPAIYAEAKMNSDYASGGANDGVTGIGGKLGFVWVNGYNTTSDKTDYSYFGSVHGIYDYGEDAVKITNPNMYVMTITSVQGTDYVVGDPRVYENATSFIEDYDWCPAPYFTDNSVSSSKNHTLTYYYPTDYASRTYNMVAPKFRVASAYSVTYANQVTDINTAKGRCASYQEDGYPAGRWRMPTKAEYEFIVYQSYKGRIPVLYDTSQNYWCAHGYGKPNAQGKIDMNGNVNSSGNLTFPNTGASIRCVYDEWYWEDYLKGTDKVPFTWGDRQR